MRRIFSSKRAGRTVAVLAVLATLVLLLSGYARVIAAEGDAPAVPAERSLSPYWDPKVQRWSALIIQAADRRHLDPDFLASLVWKESRGDADAVGPLGSVGLMQVMPKETGFGWRPTGETLLDPYTNLFWGSRTLATVIQQGQGDVFNALAAYNGGWDKVDLGVPRGFAVTILRDYASSVAARYALTGQWVAYYAVRNSGIRGPIWVADAARADVYYYGAANWIPEGVPLIPDVPPAAVVSTFLDAKTAQTYQVGLWIYDNQGEDWVSGDPVVTAFVPLPTPTPTPIPTATPVRPRVTATLPPATPTMTATVVPTATQVSTETVPVAPCAGGPLTAQAWPLERRRLEVGWEATIFVEGHGGDCVYSYAWNDAADIRGGPIAGCLVFQVQTPDPDGKIIGTILVSSGEETIQVGVYINPP